MTIRHHKPDRCLRYQRQDTVITLLRWCYFLLLQYAVPISRSIIQLHVKRSECLD